MTREEVIDLLKKDKSQRGKCFVSDALDIAINVLQKPRKKGHWIDNRNGTISCSLCQTWFHKDDRYSYMHYCPNCNAKMTESGKKNESNDL